MKTDEPREPLFVVQRVPIVLQLPPGVRLSGGIESFDCSALVGRYRRIGIEGEAVCGVGIIREASMVEIDGIPFIECMVEINGDVTDAAYARWREYLTA